MTICGLKTFADAFGSVGVSPTATINAAENAAIIYTFMGCCKLAQVDVRKWLNHFFTHIHDYDEDYSRDLLELLPHNLKQKGIL